MATCDRKDLCRGCVHDGGECCLVEVEELNVDERTAHAKDTSDDTDDNEMNGQAVAFCSPGTCIQAGVPR